MVFDDFDVAKNGVLIGFKINGVRKCMFLSHLVDVELKFEIDLIYNTSLQYVH